MKFIIYKVKNGFLLNVFKGKDAESYIFTPQERMTMFAMIDDLCGLEPPDSIGMKDSKVLFDTKKTEAKKN